jgi:hypothetical protein
MDSERREINGFKCSETDRNYLGSLKELLEKGLPKDRLGIEVLNVIQIYDRKPVNGLVRDVVSDLECHLGIYSQNNRIRDFEPRNDFDYTTGVKYFIDLLNTLQTSENFILPDNIYKTYIRWFYYENEKIEVDVLYMDHWNFILYKSKHAPDFYISVVFSQSFASWNVDFKIAGEQEQKLLSMINSGEMDKSIISDIVQHYKAEYHKNKK